MKFETLRTITAAIGARDLPGAIQAIDAALVNETGPHWNRDLSKLRAFLQDPERAPVFTVIKTDGNSKLPFAAFSALPGAEFCPGAGDCLLWCYSFRAWRYPAAFARQCQNSILLDSTAGRARILAALDSLKPGKDGALDFRLYVDGDFRTNSEIKFWFEALQDRPQLRAYGYSKSLELLTGYQGKAPANYLANVSGGHRYSADIEAQALGLDFARGAFKAVNIGRAVKSADHGTRETNRELRAVHGGKSFQCPGACGDCTPAGHACGSRKFQDIDIIIAVH